jgi:hypothetical protein
MTDKACEAHRNHIFNLGFRRGANDRDATGLPYGKHTPQPTTAPMPPTECSSDDDRKSWTDGYKMGYVIGASDRDLEKYNSLKNF